MFKVRPHNRQFLDSWNSRMMANDDTPKYDAIVTGILKKAKVDIEYIPGNLYHVESIYEILNRFDPEKSPRVDFSDPFVKAGRNASFKVFAKPAGHAYLKPVRLDQEASQLIESLHLNTKASAGYTAYGMTKGEAISIAMRKLPEVLNGKAPEPCIAGVRLQQEKYGRLVWMFPMVMSMIEGSVARPLIDHFLKSGNTTMAFGQRSTRMGMSMRASQAQNNSYVAVDQSQFDSSISAGAIRSCFSALRTWYDPQDEVGFGSTVGQLFDLIEDYFIHTPIVMPSKQGPLLYKGKVHGVPSGSYFTQLVDSYCCVALCVSTCKKLGWPLNLKDVWVLGDDLLFFTKRVNVDLDTFAEVSTSLWKYRVNAKKSSTGNAGGSVPFLGRTWVNGIPTREFSEVVKKAVAPERYRKYNVDKDKEARSVIFSYLNSSLVSGAPKDFFLVLPNLSGDQSYHSGLMKLYQKEGLVNSSPTRKLF